MLNWIHNAVMQSSFLHWLKVSDGYLLKLIYSVMFGPIETENGGTRWKEPMMMVAIHAVNVMVRFVLSNC